VRINRNDTLSTPVKLLLLSIALMILTHEMRELSSILLLLFFSFFTALTFAPLVHRLRKKGVAPILSVSLVVLLLILIIVLLGLLTVVTVAQLNERIPTYQDELTNYTESILRATPFIEGMSISMILDNIGSSLLSFGFEIFNSIVNATTAITLIIIVTAFMLLDAAGTSEQVQKEFEKEFLLMSKLHEFSKVVVDYIIVRTKTNFITGLGVAIVLLIGGIDFALFWGLVMFVFSYIPYIGLFLASIPPAFLALLEYGPVGAIVVLAVIWIINMLAEDVLFPSLAGKGLKMSPTVALLSLIYWVYVLGPAGALIAMPLTMSIKIVLESFEETEELAKLMNSKEVYEKKKESDDQDD